MHEFSAIITCDDCGDSQDFILTGESKGRDELIMRAERAGWTCDGEDLCANCAAIREWDSDDLDDFNEWQLRE